MDIEELERCVMPSGGELSKIDIEYEFKVFGINLYRRLKEGKSLKLAKETKNSDGSITKIYETPIIQFYLREFVEEKDGKTRESGFQIKTNIEQKLLED